LAKLYPAFLLDAGLLDGVQLALELRQLSGRLTIPPTRKAAGQNTTIATPVAI
jgi:hypothetical protein